MSSFSYSASLDFMCFALTLNCEDISSPGEDISERLRISRAGEDISSR